MKRIIILSLLFLLFSTSNIKSQGVDCDKAVDDLSFGWIEPAAPNVDEEVSIFIDVSKDPECKLLVGYTGDLYLWTWGPKEDKAKQGEWSASNELMKMERVSENLYRYKMIPTQFYGAKAKDIYDRGICCLAKAKDAGSGGNCGDGGKEFKSKDIHIKINIPAGAVRKVYSFPDVVGDSLLSKPDDAFILYYNNKIEEKTTVQNKERFSVYIRAYGTDGKEYRYATLFNLNNTPQLAMKKNADGLFSWAIIPSQFYSSLIPPGIKINRLRCQFIAMPYCGNSSCLVDGEYNFYFRCN